MLSRGAGRRLSVAVRTPASWSISRIASPDRRGATRRRRGSAAPMGRSRSTARWPRPRWAWTPRGAGRGVISHQRSNPEFAHAGRVARQCNYAIRRTHSGHKSGHRAAMGSAFYQDWPRGDKDLPSRDAYPLVHHSVQERFNRVPALSRPPHKSATHPDHSVVADC